MPWISIAKPTNTDWTGVAKPSESSVATFTQDAEPWGMLIAITKPSFSASITSGWTDIAKPTSSLWSLVAKPTD